MRATSAPSAKESSAPPAESANSSAVSKSVASPISPSATTAQTPAPQPNSAASPPADRVVIADAGQLRVPSFIGLSVRQVIEEAGTAGLEAEIVGNGTAHEQAPAPGAMVPPGTKIVVRCAR
jgi:cell division protein FtsI (penicillin-binding protein 3)